VHKQLQRQQVQGQSQPYIERMLSRMLRERFFRVEPCHAVQLVATVCMLLVDASRIHIRGGKARSAKTWGRVFANTNMSVRFARKNKGAVKRGLAQE